VKYEKHQPSNSGSLCTGGTTVFDNIRELVRRHTASTVLRPLVFQSQNERNESGYRHGQQAIMTVHRTRRLVDVRQSGPKSERDISGRCSVCGAVLIARLDNSQEVNPQQLRDELESLFDRHVAEIGCGENPYDPVSEPSPFSHRSRD